MAELMAFDGFKFLSRIKCDWWGGFVRVMIRMLEGRLTLWVPRQMSSLEMSGKIGLNLSPLQEKEKF